MAEILEPPSAPSPTGIPSGVSPSGMPSGCAFKSQRVEQSRACTETPVFFYGPKNYCSTHASSVQALTAKKAFVASVAAEKKKIDTKVEPKKEEPKAEVTAEKSSPVLPKKSPPPMVPSTPEPEIFETRADAKRPASVRPVSRFRPSFIAPEEDAPAQERIPEEVSPPSSPDSKAIEERRRYLASRGDSASSRSYLEARQRGPAKAPIRGGEVKTPGGTGTGTRHNAPRIPPPGRTPPKFPSEAPPKEDLRAASRRTEGKSRPVPEPAEEKRSVSKSLPREPVPAPKPRREILVPPAEKVETLKISKNKWGRYEDPETHFVFDRKTKAVYGVQDESTKKDILYQLNADDVKLCGERGWGVAVKSSLVNGVPTPVYDESDGEGDDQDSQGDSGSDENEEERSDDGSESGDDDSQEPGSDDESRDEDSNSGSDQDDDSASGSDVESRDVSESSEWEDDWRSRDASGSASDGSAEDY